VALCVERGLVRYADKIAGVWPEFGQTGKNDVTLAHVMVAPGGTSRIRRSDDNRRFNSMERVLLQTGASAPAWACGDGDVLPCDDFGWLAARSCIALRDARSATSFTTTSQAAERFAAFGLHPNFEPQSRA